MSTPSIATTLAGFSLSSVLGNASGARCSTKDDLLALANFKFTGIVTSKSCTVEPREGNPEPRWFENDIGSINSMGIPNLGYQFYGSIAPEIHAHKPYFVSVSGMKLEDNIKIVSDLNKIPEVDAIELNLSCPNLVGKPQVGYDFEQTKVVLEEVTAVCQKPLGVKLPPYFDFVHFEQMAKILTNFPQLRFVTCINSVGNGLVIDVETESAVIKPKGGFGGIGGDYVKPTALANVRKFRELLPLSVDIVGCGGVRSGADAFEHILCGASFVQIGTLLQRDPQHGGGVECFERVASELQQLMAKKGYTSIDQFKNQLKTL